MIYLRKNLEEAFIYVKIIFMQMVSIIAIIGQKNSGKNLIIEV